MKILKIVLVTFISCAAVACISRQEKKEQLYPDLRVLVPDKLVYVKMHGLNVTVESDCAHKVTHMSLEGKTDDDAVLDEFRTGDIIVKCPGDKTWRSVNATEIAYEMSPGTIRLGPL